jgi:hypothetical protein
LLHRVIVAVTVDWMQQLLTSRTSFLSHNSTSYSWLTLLPFFHPPRFMLFSSPLLIYTQFLPRYFQLFVQCNIYFPIIWFDIPSYIVLPPSVSRL